MNTNEAHKLTYKNFKASNNFDQSVKWLKFYFFIKHTNSHTRTVGIWEWLKKATNFTWEIMLQEDSMHALAEYFNFRGFEKSCAHVFPKNWLSFQSKFTDKSLRYLMSSSSVVCVRVQFTVRYMYMTHKISFNLKRYLPSNTKPKEASRL